MLVAGVREVSGLEGATAEGPATAWAGCVMRISVVSPALRRLATTSSSLTKDRFAEVEALEGGSWIDTEKRLRRIRMSTRC